MTTLILFYVSAAVTLVSAVLAITRTNASHALIYLVITLLAIAVIFFLLGAPFAAALQIVVYAGAIVVLFLFVVMMLNLGRQSVEREKSLLTSGIWTVPSILGLTLFAVLLVALVGRDPTIENMTEQVTPKQVGVSLYSEYILVVELAGVLLLAALVAAYHLGRRYLSDRREEEEQEV